MTSFTTPVYLQSITQFFMNYKYDISFAQPAYPLVPPPFHLLTWVPPGPRYIRWLQTSKNPIFRQHAPEPEPEANEPNEPSSRKAQQQKIQKLQKKVSFVVSTGTIVEDWRGRVVVNWMIFFFRMICTGRNVFWYVIPWGWKKSQTYHDLSSDFLYMALNLWRDSGWDSFWEFRFTPWNPLGFPGPDTRKYLPRMTFSKGQPRPKWLLDAPRKTRKLNVELWKWFFSIRSSLFFWPCWSPWSIPSLSMHCTWNSLINLENKNKDLESESFFPKHVKTIHGRDVSSPFRPSHHFVGVGRRCLVLRNQRFNAGVNKNDRCPQGQSYLVNQQRGCWDGMTWGLTKIACHHKKTRWWFFSGEKNNLFNRWDEEFS